MSLPPRLSESGNDFGAKLLRAARAERPSRDGAKRAAIAASAAVLSTCAGVAEKSASTTGIKIPRWVAALGAGAAIVGAGMGLFSASSVDPNESSSTKHVSMEEPSSPPAVSSNPSSSPLVVSATPSSPPVVEITTAAPAPPAVPIVPEAVPSSHGTREVAPPPASAQEKKGSSPPSVKPTHVDPSSDVEDELTLLRRAKARVAANEPGGALEVLEVFAKQYPRSAFGEEAAALRVEALAASGDGARARRAADAFFARYPDSPYAQRIESVLAQIPR